MIKNIIFDIGNVFLKFNPDEYFGEMFNDYKLGEKLSTLIMTSRIWEEYDLGLATLEDVRNDFKKQKPELSDQINLMLDQWTTILKPIEYTFNKLNQLKKEGYKVYLLSNLSIDAYNYIKEHYHLFDEVDGYVLSFEENKRKPDEEIYELILNRYNLKKEESVFIDDMIRNVEASIHFGLPAILFENEKQVEEVLNKMLNEGK